MIISLKINSATVDRGETFDIARNVLAATIFAERTVETADPC